MKVMNFKKLDIYHLRGILSVVFFSFMSFVLLGQSTPMGNANDPKAKKILDKIKSDYEKNKSSEVVFELVIETPGSKPEKQNGKLVQEGKKFVALMDDQEVYCDGKNVWFYLKSEKEVQINNYDANMSDEMVSPEQLLRIYENGEYIYAITGEEQIGTKTLTNIEFKPKNRNSQYSKIRIGVDKTNNPNYIKVFSKNGATYTLVLKSTTHNKVYKADYFVFNTKKVPGLHVEDLRID